MVAVPIVAVWLVRFTVVPEDVVPMAMKLAVWPAAVSVCEPGTMASETRGSIEEVMFTVSIAVPVTTVPSGFVATAVIAVVPLVTDVATPVAALIVATEGTLDFQDAAWMVAVPIVAVWLVRFTVEPLDVLPMAINPAVWPAAVSVCEAGTMASETRGSGEPDGATVRVALPAAPEPSVLVKVAVMVVVPDPTEVATPVVALIEAIDGTLEVHLIPAVFDSGTEAPLIVKPIASNCMGTPTVATVCEAGMTMTEETSVSTQAVHAVTVKVAELLRIIPLYPFALAVIFVNPVHSSPVAGLKPVAVANPELLIVATWVRLEDQVTWSVISTVVWWPAWP